MRSKENLILHELIGLKAEVVFSGSFSLVGMKGKVVDETKNTFTLEMKRDSILIEKKIPKKGNIFRFRLPDGSSAEIDGSEILYSPEDRAKKVLRRKKLNSFI